MEKLQWNSINKKQNGLEKSKNKQFTSLTKARAYLPWARSARSSGWITQLIAYACNPSTASWGEFLLNLETETTIKLFITKENRSV